MNKQAGKHLLLELPEITSLVSLTSQKAHEGEGATLEGLMNTNGFRHPTENQMTLN